MQLVKLEYGRVDEVSYWVDLSLGQGEFPRDPSLRHVKWMKWLGSRLNGRRGHSVSFMGVFVEGVWYLRLQCTFSKPIICHSFIIS
jgi:hypothetical protein